MHLLIDGRPLQSGTKSGIPRVTEALIEALARERGAHEITILTTGRAKPVLSFPDGIRHVHLAIPNKLLHAYLWLFKKPELDMLVANETGTAVDCVLLPNLHFFASRAPYALLVHDLSFLLLPHYLPRYDRLVHAQKRPKELMKHAEALFAVSRSTVRDIEATTGRTDAQIIDLKNLIPRVTHENETPYHGAPYILMLGTTEPRKNIEAGVEGFLMWKKSHPNKATLKIAGALTPHGKMLQIKYGAIKEIDWLGTVSDSEKYELLKNARTLLYPSVFEGFGIPLLEAARLGTPIITSHATSMPEVACRNAMLIDPHRPETIAAALAHPPKQTIENENAQENTTKNIWRILERCAMQKRSET